MKRVWVHVGLIAFSAYILLPILWIIRTSFVPESMSYSSSLMPGFTLDNFAALLNRRNFGNSLLRSLIVSLGATLIALPFAAATGFAFARYRTGGNLGRFLVLATQMLPAIVLVLPTFTIFRSLGLTNSIFGLMIVYAALNLPFLTWILMGFFEGIPVELEWAAMIDGANPWTAFWRVVIPVSLPGLASAGILGFIMAWNEFIFALILTGPATATVPVSLAALQTQNGIRIADVSAGVVLAVIPLAIIARYAQRFIVSGLTFGAVK
ncbi:carbohydrate ABC transporter permease [Microvirga pakistanensis]|uniref:carbohydrate ABC transporter permease n=1 Tax=Microvirga pakistanensis TaxID=1682650 RepID=UPI00106D9147|nr:carbohydrate ABC transporter permease [Microvirga pakistanensis]